jgi:glutathione S-transferase
MADIIIYGPPQSSYVRTARHTANEKGITHELRPVGDDLKKLHPYSKFPILEHNGFRVFETAAICNYVNSVFDGPDLVPDDAKARATMEQWISCIDCYIYDHAIRNYALKYIFAGEDGPDRETIDANVPLVKRDFELLDRAVGDSGYLVGDELTLGDLFIVPVVTTTMMFPEGKEIVGGCRNLSRVVGEIAQRDAFQAAQPASPTP